jgi:hypothetical protein
MFDLSGKKVYDLKGVNIYRLSGELVGHLIDARGSDKRLDRGLLLVQGQGPELDKPKTRPGLQRPLSECFAEAIRLRQIICWRRAMKNGARNLRLHGELRKEESSRHC